MTLGEIHPEFIPSASATRLLYWPELVEENFTHGSSLVLHLHDYYTDLSWLRRSPPVPPSSNAAEVLEKSGSTSNSMSNVFTLILDRFVSIILPFRLCTVQNQKYGYYFEDPFPYLDTNDKITAFFAIFHIWLYSTLIFPREKLSSYFAGS